LFAVPQDAIDEEKNAATSHPVAPQDHAARLTSVQEEDPAVLAVPFAQATQAVDVTAVAPPRE